MKNPRATLVVLVPILLVALSATSAAAAPAAAATKGIAAASVVVSHLPFLEDGRPRDPLSRTSSTWASLNWSGYAITGRFTSVIGNWTVPSVSCSSKTAYSASWVGADGFKNHQLIQTGTGQDCTNGSARYYAWWEILPSPETRITGMTVKAGDHMSASVRLLSGTTWRITISDGSQSFTIDRTYNGHGRSAEWIEEAPSVNGQIATLANYGSTVFDPGTVNGGNPGLTGSDGGVMIQNSVQVSTPSGPDRDTDGFAIKYGSTAPAAPGS